MHARAAAALRALFADELFDMRAATAAARAGPACFRDLVAAPGAFTDYRANYAVVYLHAVTDDHRSGARDP